MGVAVDATATADVSAASGSTAISNANLTVGANATALLAILTFFTGATAFTVQWDSTGTPQTMTLLQTAAGASRTVALYGLLRPTPGLKTCHAAWTTGSAACLDLISFTGTPTDAIANAFKNGNSNTGTSSSATVTGTSAIGNISVSGVTCASVNVNSISATGSTGIFTDNAQIASGGARATGAATVAWTGTLSGSGAWAIGVIDVAQPLVYRRSPYTPQLQPLLAQ